MIQVIGHRGARGHLPENTLESFRYAIGLGVDGLELDVGVSRDGVVVVHHDRRLNPEVARGPDGKWLEGDPPAMFSMDFSELRKIDIGRIRPGSEYDRRFPHQKPVDGLRMPRLSEVLSLETRLNVEVKSSAKAPDDTPPPESFARAVVAEIREAKAEKRCAILSFDFRILKVVEREAAELPTVYLTEGADCTVENVRKAGAKTWACQFTQLDEAKVRGAREAGMRIVVWTVNDPAEIDRAFTLGVDAIISDYPDRVLARRAR